jgi:galactokinase
MGKSIVELFNEAYGEKPAAVAKAPGRLEILGNHTDYNDGFVLSCAVGQATEFAILPIEGRDCELRDFRDQSCKTFNLDDIDNPPKGDWSNYVKGVICELRKRGKDVGAFKGAILSTVPLSAGMSSSAALEISAGFAFAEVFNIELSNPDWARVGQGVENNYMGLQSGLLDQFSSIFGEKDKLIFCDFRSVTVEDTITFPHGYVFVVANSMIKHDLVDSDYNLRRVSCEKVAEVMKAKHPEVKALRDVSTEMLNAAKDVLDEQDFRIALHVVGECERVHQGVEALANKDVKAFGELLYESHESSRVNFTNSCPEMDILIDLAKASSECIGARLSGGGFGGITIHLVKEEEAEGYCRKIKEGYKAKTGIDPEMIICAMGSGASVERV